MTETCATCKFGKILYQDVDKRIVDVYGRVCHRYAPRPGKTDQIWPIVNHDDWCGEYVTRTKLNAIELEDRETWDIDKRYASVYVSLLNTTMSDLAVYRTITEAPPSVIKAWAEAAQKFETSIASNR